MFIYLQLILDLSKQISSECTDVTEILNSYINTARGIEKNLFSPIQWIFKYGKVSIHENVNYIIITTSQDFYFCV